MFASLYTNAIQGFELYECSLFELNVQHQRQAIRERAVSYGPAGTSEHTNSRQNNECFH